MSEGSLASGGAYGSACFLCHRPLLPRRRGAAEPTQVDAVVAADEDVVPKWLMRMFSLGGASAVMPNGQLRGYGQRKVPCCFECNQRMSTHLEQPVRAAVAAGGDAVRAMDTSTLLLWMAKLYYGTRFYETRFRTNVADPDSPPMLEHSELLDRNDYLRRLLLTVPQNLTLLTPPATVFAFRAGVPKDDDARFDLFVSAFADVDLISVRIGESFVVAVFGDNGHWSQRFGGIRIVEHAAAEMELHPAQCTEISMWLADTSGSWDFITVGPQAEKADDEGAVAPPGTPGAPIPGPETTTLFASRFTVTANEASAEMVRLLRTNTFLSRLGFTPTPAELERAKAGTYAPTLLINVGADEPVHATCFEPGCPDLFRRAGWTTNLPPCPYCGAESDGETSASAER
jgi:hypothetical protein